MTCERCYGQLELGEHGLYRCALQPRRAAAVRPDSIPGGLTIEHGLCDDDGNPVTYYSQSEIDRACAAKGMRRWSDVYSEDKTRDAREQIAWQQSGEARRLTAQNQEASRQREHEEQRRSQGGAAAMTFQQMVTDICGRLNLVSAEATARVGLELNQHYRKVTATLGLEQLRYITRTGTTALNSDKVTFTGLEKLDRVFERAPDGAVLVLEPVALAVIREGRELQGSRYGYAIWQQTAKDITILLPGLALAITDLYADGWTTLADLTGADEPAIPGSFHRILIDNVMGDEYLRKEKTELADRYYATAEASLRELRFHIADAPARELRQGDNIIANAGGGGTGGSGSSVITGDIVFDRDPSPPFHVTPGSGKVDNLDADLLDGQHGAFYQNGANLTDNSVSFAKLPDLPASNLLGRTNASGGDPQPITLGVGLAITGTTLNASGGALPGAHHATHEPGGADALVALDAGILTQGTIPPARIGADSVTNDKLANLPASNLLGRGSAAGAGDPQPLTVGSGLQIAGTVLQASGTAVGAPGGLDTQVQFNDAGVLAGDAGLTFTKGTKDLSVGGNVYVSGNYVVGKAGQQTIVKPNTADGADDGLISLWGGGAFGGTRGAMIDVGGNENSFAPGSILLTAAPAGQILVNKGIAFPATAVPSSDVNTLDDYREGTWTPTLSGASGGSGQTYSQQIGIHQKVGRWVTLNFSITLSAVGTLSGALEIRGIPYASDAASVIATATIGWHSMSAAFTCLIGQLDPGGAVIRLSGATAASNTVAVGIPASSVGSGSVLFGTVRYQTAN